jgi:alkaline phosphatase/alkaline phosphatase D
MNTEHIAVNKFLYFVCCLSLSTALSSTTLAGGDVPIGTAQGVFAGELTETGAILQSRLTTRGRDENGEVQGITGVARFELSEDPEFANFDATDWLTALADNDFIVKARVDGLAPATVYHFRLRYGRNEGTSKLSGVSRFETLAGPAISRPVTFTALTCMNYEKFHFGDFNAEGEMKLKPYPGHDKHLGYPALSYISLLEPQFVIYNGDNVYYDQNPSGQAVASTVEDMRFRWHRQYSQPRLLDIMGVAGGYWLKDDHDFRFNDSDLEGDRAPSPKTGIRIFREQVPVVDPALENAVTYRTRRVSRELQLWFLEGRDYRSPNAMEDGPGKSIWGKEQMAWLKKTLKASDAVFKILIVPSPMVGPDKGRKSDNHTNFGGFRHEAGEFFAWLGEEGFSPEELFIITGDRHWQYHSIHPSGFQEFSAGSISYANAQRAVKPGDARGTDPQGLIKQPYVSPDLRGGFLQVYVIPGGESRKDEFKVRVFDEWGRNVYTYASLR